MNRKRIVKIGLSIMLIIIFSSSGYILGKNNSSKGINSLNTTSKSENIDISITNTSRMPTSGTGYVIKIKNVSPYLIKQNSVYISYPIKHGSSQTMNNCKIEATGNKINIKPNEVVILNAFIPCENYESMTI